MGMSAGRRGGGQIFFFGPEMPTKIRSVVLYGISQESPHLPWGCFTEKGKTPKGGALWVSPRSGCAGVLPGVERFCFGQAFCSVSVCAGDGLSGVWFLVLKVPVGHRMPLYSSTFLREWCGSKMSKSLEVEIQPASNFKLQGFKSQRFQSVTFRAGHGDICLPHGRSTWRPADQSTTRRIHMDLVPF